MRDIAKLLKLLRHFGVEELELLVILMEALNRSSGDLIRDIGDGFGLQLGFREFRVCMAEDAIKSLSKGSSVAASSP